MTTMTRFVLKYLCAFFALVVARCSASTASCSCARRTTMFGELEEGAPIGTKELDGRPTESSIQLSMNISEQW